MKKLFFAVFLLFFITVNVQAQAPYYQGKTIRIVTGFPAGDVNDTWPRLIGQHMTKYIPGNPTFIVQNMTGAGSMIAANHVYGVAKPDGLTLGWILPAAVLRSTRGTQGSSVRLGQIQFDRFAGTE